MPVFAAALKALAAAALQAINEAQTADVTNADMDCTHDRWCLISDSLCADVVTVPAIWSPGAKQLMREGAITIPTARAYRHECVVRFQPLSVLG